MTSPASADRTPFSGVARFADDTRRRFLATIVARVPLDRLVEVHLFPPMRQGGVETGVAVVAATLETAESETTESDTAEASAVDASSAACDPTEDAAVVPDSAQPDSVISGRHTVFTARYRVTVRGPDRGRWDADVEEVADAPLVTVDAVVRGVQRRAGDTADPERLGPEVVGRILGPPPIVPNVPNAPRVP